MHCHFPQPLVSSTPRRRPARTTPPSCIAPPSRRRRTTLPPRTAPPSHLRRTTPPSRTVPPSHLCRTSPPSRRPTSHASAVPHRAAVLSSPHHAAVSHRAAVLHRAAIPPSPHHAAVPYRAAIPPSPHHADVPPSDEPRVFCPPSPRKDVHRRRRRPFPSSGAAPPTDNLLVGIIKVGDKIGLKHFKPVKPLGCGDTGSVHLVELQGSGELFAMKAMDKSVMLNRNKVILNDEHSNALCYSLSVHAGCDQLSSCCC
ncbi:hypothetical protein GUJ93_ZPchr0013g34189 [Zizania palustris]|uniref:non-specific serine/threonine protein kinase n=1 Tax=Zizania palustris TaxID=103762 RepID=A0A8J6C1Y6_ZIZPA|nr:hypothetical protein GUJ93_ZPchr0013g34189 [Zizania palustris]